MFESTVRSAGDDSTRTRRRTTASAPRLLLFWEGGSDVRELRAPARLVVGRSADCDLTIPHDSVSRRHAVIHGGDDGWHVEDLGSSNGTFVGGTKLRPGSACGVGPGVVVAIGDARLVLDLPGAEDAADTERAGAAPPPPLDDPMHRVERLIELVADSALPVMLLGETGTGKNRLAERIHRMSSRAQHPFVQIDCAAVAEEAFESELLAHPGATVFLDDVTELARATQSRLLHVLEHAGADVRIVSATSRDIEQLVASRSFRRDLYFRLAGVLVRIPPLRERLRELRELAGAFVAEARAQSPRAAATISEDAMRSLCAHPWPGNVRELRNVVMRAAVLCRSGAVRPEHLLLDATGPHRRSSDPAVAAAAPRPLAADVRETERRRILEALARFGGHQGKAAEYLGVSRRTLTNKLTELALPRPRKGKTRD
jgi:two-component system, NtrC family, response regulator AtoC